MPNNRITDPREAEIEAWEEWHERKEAALVAAELDDHPRGGDSFVTEQVTGKELVVGNVIEIDYENPEAGWDDGRKFNDGRNYSERRWVKVTKVKPFSTHTWTVYFEDPIVGPVIGADSSLDPYYYIGVDEEVERRIK